MNKSKKTKNLLILIVLIAIVAIAVGYATLAQNLVLNGTAHTLSASDWNVHFVNNSATMDPDTDEEHDGVFEQTITLNGTTGTFEVTLAPGASIDYELEIINDGKIHAIKGADPVVSNTGSSNITCTATLEGTAKDLYTENGTSSGTDKYKVHIECAEMTTLPSTAETATITVTFNYVQNHTS